MGFETGAGIYELLKLFSKDGSNFDVCCITIEALIYESTEAFGGYSYFAV